MILHDAFNCCYIAVIPHWIWNSIYWESDSPLDLLFKNLTPSWLQIKIICSWIRIQFMSNNYWFTLSLPSLFFLYHFYISYICSPQQDIHCTFCYHLMSQVIIACFWTWSKLLSVLQSPCKNNVSISISSISYSIYISVSIIF